MGVLVFLDCLAHEPAEPMDGLVLDADVHLTPLSGLASRISLALLDFWAKLDLISLPLPLPLLPESLSDTVFLSPSDLVFEQARMLGSVLLPAFGHGLGDALAALGCLRPA